MQLLEASKPDCAAFLWMHYVLGLDDAEMAVAGQNRDCLPRSGEGRRVRALLKIPLRARLLGRLRLGQPRPFTGLRLRPRQTPRRCRALFRRAERKSALPRVDDFHPGLREILDVAGDQSEIVLQRRRRDQSVHHGKPCATQFRLGCQQPPAFCDSLRDRQ